MLARNVATEQEKRRYWRRNLTYLGILLTIWFTVSFLCGIVFVDELDSFQIGGFKLGFWFAQQGSIFIFVALIFVYVFLMNRLERRTHLQESTDTDDEDQKEAQ
jgi:putative solute:sodium symporter small subunit